MENRNNMKVRLQKDAEAKMIKKTEAVHQTFKNHLKRLENSLSYGRIEQQLTLCCVLINMRPVYLAPVYHLCQYQFMLANLSFELHEAINQINFEATLRSMRILIDRVALILSSIFPEMKQEDNFGYYDDKHKKGTGMMKIILQKQQSDEFMKYLVASHDAWINRLRRLDNNLKHKHNFVSVGKVVMENGIMPDFPSTAYLDKDIHEGIDLNNSEEVEKLEINDDDLNFMVEKTYELINRTIEYAIEKIS